MCDVLDCQLIIRINDLVVFLYMQSRSKPLNRCNMPTGVELPDSSKSTYQIRHKPWQIEHPRFQTHDVHGLFCSSLLLLDHGLHSPINTSSRNNLLILKLKPGNSTINRFYENICWLYWVEEPNIQNLHPQPKDGHLKDVWMVMYERGIGW